MNVPLTIACLLVSVVGLAWLFGDGLMNLPETLSHTPKLGKTAVCEGLEADDLAEWWESYGQLRIRLGDGRIFCRYRRDSQHRQVLLGYKWEPCPTVSAGVYPVPEIPVALLNSLEARITAGLENERLNRPLNGWRW